MFEPPLFERPLKVASLMHKFDKPWFMAGGWAIDLFLDKITRPHADIEIAVFRKDQLAVQKHLAKWILKKADNGLLSRWTTGEFLQLPVHAIHCFNKQTEPSFLEILLNESDHNKWIFRRNNRITKPFSELFLTSASGINFLCPEIVLLYKSKNPRPKDEADFKNTVPQLGQQRIVWLRDALEVFDSESNWFSKLQKL
jgi:hypothetical protein